jgi:type III restriction enzyme
MADSNPILNNPYEEPRFHYATTLDGGLDYEHAKKGRRVFTSEVQGVPIKTGSPKELLPVHESLASHSRLQINRAGKEEGL